MQRTLADFARRQNNVMCQAQDSDPDDPFTRGLRQTYNDLDAKRRAALAAELDATEAAAPAHAGLLWGLFETTHLTVQRHPDRADITIRLPADDLPHSARAAERITNTVNHAQETPVRK